MMATRIGTKIIHTSEAVIRTATVEVKSLTVSGKQMTLALFKQLYDEDLIDRYSGEMNGAPWGIVNYHWDECKVKGQLVSKHIHVIWQRGNELRRSYVKDRRDSSNDNEILRDLSDDATLLVKIIRYRDFLNKVSLNDHAAIRPALNIEPFVHDGMTFRLVNHNNFMVAPHTCNESYSGYNLEASEKRCQEYYAARIAGFTDAYNDLRQDARDKDLLFGDDERLEYALSYIIADLRKHNKLSKERDSLYDQHYREVAALEQLFIAV